MAGEIHAVNAISVNVPLTAPTRPASAPKAASAPAPKLEDTLIPEAPERQRAVEAAVHEANRALEGTSVAFRFSIDSETDQIVVRIMNEETGEIIRQIPPDEQLSIARHLDQVLGVLFSRRV